MDRKRTLLSYAGPAILLAAAASLGVAKSIAEPARNVVPKEIVGVASVIDGDTLDIHGSRIRLVGVDAPESGQKCRDAGRKFVRCGTESANALDQWINRNPVSCAIEGKDRYGRFLGACSVRGANMQEWLVSNGRALAYRAYSTAYVPAELNARKAKVGVWAGEFVQPWDWRQGLRLDGEKATKAMVSGKFAAN